MTTTNPCCARCGRPTPEALQPLRLDWKDLGSICVDCVLSLADWLDWPRAELALAEHGAIEGATLTANTDEYQQLWT